MEQTSIEAQTPAIRMSGVAVGSMQDLRTIVLENIAWTVQVGDYWVIAGLQGSGNSDLFSGLFGVYGSKAEGKVVAAPAAKAFLDLASRVAAQVSIQNARVLRVIQTA